MHNFVLIKVYNLIAFLHVLQVEVSQKIVLKLKNLN